MTHHSPTARHRPRRGLASLAVIPLLALAAALAVVGAAPAGAQDDAPGIDQTVAAEEPIAADTAVLDDGHVDIGPRFVDGTWTLMARDDSAATPTWRNLDDTVLQIHDAALNPVPDDPNYAFLGVDPGTQVHVVPQTQNPAVVWVGWNTQDPEVMERIDRGATLSLLGVDGPGELTMYLQSGIFGAPEILWDSTDDEAQPIWVDVNTHTHANWVFSEPGVYLVHVEVSADLIDGTQVTDTRALRFAVGDTTSTDDAFAAVATTPQTPPSDAGAEADEESVTAESDDRNGGGSTAIIAIIVAALALVAGLAVVVRRSSRSRTQAEQITAERGTTGDTTGTGPTGPGTS